MEEKRKDLIVTHQKEIVNEVVTALNALHPSFYYLSTAEIAIEIKKYIEVSGNLSLEKYALMKDLSHVDIQILLSFHKGKSGSD